jgi:hypothetical protein
MARAGGLCPPRRLPTAQGILSAGRPAGLSRQAAQNERLRPILEEVIMISELSLDVVPFSQLTDEQKEMLFGADAKSELVEKTFGEHSFSVTPLAQTIIRTVQVATSGVAAHPALTVLLPSDFRVVGGGAQDNWSGEGNMLTASRPVFQGGLEGWFGAGKDHIDSSPASITVWVIGLKGI